MAEDLKVDVAVVGAGPGGYVAALRAAQLGLSVAVIEREFLGGTCLNIGCIPSKALLDATHLLSRVRSADAFGIVTGEVEVDFAQLQRHRAEVVETLTGGVRGLLRKAGTEIVEGHGRFAERGVLEVELSDGGNRTVQADHVIVATGSDAAPVPGIEFDGDVVVSSREALEFDSIPDRLVVVGAGYIGLELGSVYSRLGSDVVVLEMMDRALPEMDAEMAAEAADLLADQGLDIRLGARVAGVEAEDGVATVSYERDDETETVDADRVLVAVGRRPYTEGLGLDAIGLSTGERGFIAVDEGMRSEIEGVYAIGDVVPTPMLAHVASEEGVVAVERIAGHSAEMDYHAVPAVVYTHPELASVGLKEDEARERGHELVVGKFPFRANGRARTLGETEGWVKVLADADTDELVGVHCIGPDAGHLIHEAVVAMGYRGYAEDLALTIHAHPTLSEAFKEAALGAGDGTIHI